MATEARAGEDREAIATAVGLYVLAAATLGQAAETAGVSRFRMRAILTDAGIEVYLGGVESIEAARRDLDVLEAFARVERS